MELKDIPVIREKVAARLKQTVNYYSYGVNDDCISAATDEVMAVFEDIMEDAMTYTDLRNS